VSHTEFRALPPETAPQGAAGGGGWRATLARRQAYHRLYVHTPEGVPIGWYDLESGDVHAIDAEQQDALARFVSAWIASPDAAGLSALPSPHAPTARVEVRRPAPLLEPRAPDAAPQAPPASPVTPPSTRREEPAGEPAAEARRAAGVFGRWCRRRRG